MTAALSFRYLDEPAMIEAGVRDMAACVDVQERALVLLTRNDYRMAGSDGNSHGAMISFPENPSIENMPKDGPDRRFMAMPAYLGGDFRATGVKWYGSNIENRNLGLPRSIHLFVLNDTDTGAPLAIMSANLLSAYRTGAIPGVAVRHLARTDAKVFGLIGPGVIGRAVTEAVLSQRTIETIVVKGYDDADVERFRTYASERFPDVEIVAASDYEDLVRQSDIVAVTVTTDASGPSGFPYIDHSWIKPGALMLHPAAVRYDDEVWDRPDVRCVVDYTGLYEAWEEEMGDAAYEKIGILGCHWYSLARNGSFDLSRIQNIGSIADGSLPARQSDDEVIIYSAGGMPIEDVAWAHHLHAQAEERNIGVVLPLWEEPALR